MGLEENADDPCKFTLISRSSNGTLERFTFHSTSPAVSQAWIHHVSQILENQRNFLNGKTLLMTARRWCLVSVLEAEQRATSFLCLPARFYRNVCAT